MDDWTHECQSLSVREVSQVVQPDSAALDEVVRVLHSSRSPALVVGSQIEEDHGWDEVIALAEHLSADVYQQPIPPRWTFPRTHKLFRGGLLPAQNPLADQLASYDTIVVLGAPVFLYYAYVPGHTVKPGTKLLQITNSPQDAAAALAGTSIVGNLASAARYIRSRVKSVERAASAQIAARTKPPEPAPEYPMTCSYVF